MLKYLLFFLIFPLFAAEPQSVVITFSDGTTASGSLSAMGSRPLYINSEKAVRSKDRKLELSDIVSLTQKVETASMEKPWMFKESGRTDKVYFEGEYPFVNFLTEILLVNGEVVRGHIIAMAFRFKGNAPSKLFLNRQIKGKTGEKMDDLKYISKIEFANKPVGNVKDITGSVTGYGKVLQVNAVDLERHVIVSAELKGNTFTLNRLLPGKYDVFILTDEAVLAGFGGKNDFPDALKKNFELADDFFKERFQLRLNGSRSLVYKRRAKFHASEKHVKGGFLWHLEIWNWHTAGTEWKLDSRDLPLRLMQKGGEKNRKFLLLNVLENVEPGAAIAINRETEHEFIRILD